MLILVLRTKRKNKNGNGAMEKKVPIQTGMKGNQMRKIQRKILQRIIINIRMVPGMMEILALKH